MTSQLYCQGAALHTEQSHLMAESCKTGVQRRTDALREPQAVRLTVAIVPDIDKPSELALHYFLSSSCFFNYCLSTYPQSCYAIQDLIRHLDIPSVCLETSIFVQQ